MYAIVALIVALLVLSMYFYYQKSEDIFQKYYYFDNNGTTRLNDAVRAKMTKSLYLGNSSAVYAATAKREIDDTKAEVRDWVQSPDYKVIFTSCGSEGINTIIRAIADEKPNSHFITSEVEHKTTLDCFRNLHNMRKIDITILPVDSMGLVSPDEVAAAIKPTTTLVSIIHINNETGAINDIAGIGAAIKRASPKVIFHVDAVQSFAKMSIPLERWQIDAMSISAHKFNGPLGIGALIMHPRLPLEYALICGSQNDGMRGGTENIPAIVGLGEAIRVMRRDRSAKNDKMQQQINYIESYIRRNLPTNAQFVRITPAVASPNVLLGSIVRNDGVEFCNIKLKNLLFARNVVISIGSACNTKSKYASHVVKAIGLPIELQKGVIRISVGDDTTWHDCRQMCNIFNRSLSQLCSV